MAVRARWLRLVLVAALVIAAAIAVWLARREVVTVDVTAVARGRVEQTATNSRAGTVTARRRAKLSPEAGGRVAALPHRRGETVHAGEVVLELDAVLERGEVALRDRDVVAAAAERERACLAAERAARELERNRRLAAEQLVPVDLLDRYESAAREAEAACRAARAVEERAASARSLAASALAKRTLRAPFDGIVAELSIEVGEWTTPSPPALPVPPVVDLVDPSSIYLALPMDEVDAALLRPGLPVRATVDSHPGQSFPGRIARIAPYVLDVEAQNRTVEIEVELDDPEVAATLLPGTSADVEVVLESRADAVRVPAAALLAGDRVLVLEGDRLSERRVSTGLRNWDFVEILSGLEPGERVVTSLDREEVRAGARARAAAPAGSAAS